MANLAKLEFVALGISGKNYLPWVLNAEIHLDTNSLGDTIKDENESSNQNKEKDMIFLRRHLHEGLKYEYLTMKYPLELWTNLRERYDHLKTVILPKARYDWMHLRLQDFKSVSEYNSALFNISSQLKLCGENITNKDMLEKTFSTFHATNVLLQQQYREREFERYYELISCILLAEQNNDLLMKNHESHPTGANPFPEANTVIQNNENCRGRGHGRDRVHARGRGRGFYRYRPSSHGRSSYREHEHKRWNNKHEKNYGANGKPVESICYHCSGKGHWSRTYRTPQHFIDHYKESMKTKGKKEETNFSLEMGEVNHSKFESTHGKFDYTHLDVADFLVNMEEKQM